ncbi:hypothetical protein M231_02743 [Tremella mesenterica]|uniref:Cytochrome c oxidase assembly protein n=1 Tax=Tremella mesenterica TaxID=5217 RepID=A0A4Q1BPW3_TREME|nr:hypothetical protein M231_02743 [Tremella mesenterica]
MSKTAKAFFGGSVILSAFTVWGVHYLQKRESDTMYLGVLRDEARLRAKAAEKQALESLPSASSIGSSILITPSSSISNKPSSSPSSISNQPIPISSSSNLYQSIPFISESSQFSSPPTPLTETITQPPPLIDPDCPVCVISPPPQLLQNLSPEDRRKDREDRKKEYENQKVLAGTLSVEQGVSERWV